MHIPSARCRAASVRQFCAALAAVALAFGAFHAAAQTAATATAVSGTVAVQGADGTTRLLGRSSTLREGDLVSTQADSFARLRFSDGGEMAVRPNTQVRIDTYRFVPDAPQQDSVVVSLLKGGLRSITGLISRRGDRSGYQLRTPTATIGVRGTDYIARVCGDDCAQELAVRETGARRALAPALVARVVQVQGEATAETPGGSRRLGVGDPVYRRDRIQTAGDATLVLAFLDQSRIVLLPGSRFSVDEYRYEPRRPGAGTMLLNLTQGGLRALTGLIARARPQAVRVTTPTATVGVRGTGIDVYVDLEATLALLQARLAEARAAGPAADPALDEAQRQAAEARREAQLRLVEAQIALIEALIASTQPAGGLNAAALTWQGSTFMAAGDQRRNMDEFDGVGQGRDNRLFDLPPELLDRLRNFPAPRPDQFAFDPKLFGEAIDLNEGGLYALVKGGSIVIEQQPGLPLVLVEGEAGGGPPGRQLVRLDFVPGFLEGDRFLGPPTFDPQMCRP